MPGEKAGMKVGDEILTLNGKPVLALSAMIDALKHTKDQPLDITVLRDGQPMTFHVTPVLTDTDGEKRYRIGVASLPMKVKHLPVTEAFQQSLKQNKEGSVLILQLVRKMIQGKISTHAIQGPIGISVAAGKAAQKQGWMPLLELTAAISLNLGIFNLLPIPILDGGVILLLFIEGLMRRDISMVIKERVYQAAFVFLVLFAVMVIYNDIQKTGVFGRLP
jgi:regulator of sigma E protease